MQKQILRQLQITGSAILILTLISPVQSQDLLKQFKEANLWKTVGEVEADGAKLKTLSEGDEILLNGEQKNNAPYLMTNQTYEDVSFKMEFMIPKGSNSGVYFMGRYEIQIFDSYGKKKWAAADLGGLYQRWKNNKGYEGVAAKVNAAKPAGEWQTMDVIFRAPRFAADGTKLSHATFVKVEINGKLVQKDLVAKGPTRSCIWNNEDTQGPIVIQGDHGPIAIRNLEIKAINLDSYKAAPVSEAESAPLDHKGNLTIDMVSHGKTTFINKGCAECHATDAAAGVNKTGPSLFALYKKNPQKHKVIDSAEEHLIEITADQDYIRSSVRDSKRHLALDSNDGDKPYLPIMPSYSLELLSDSELENIIAYLGTLNAKADQGPLRKWISKPSPQYDLAKDNNAIWVKDTPRLQRVHLGSKHSARAYHVGLPGGVNYSFDPRTLGIVEIWNGPFLNVKNERDGRANKPSTYGHSAKAWPSENHLFRPFHQTGSLVDFSLKEPANIDGELGQSMVEDTGDFLMEVKSNKARFIGVETPANEIPSFRYKVDNNLVEIQFIPNNDGAVEARFKLKLKQAQIFQVPQNLFSGITVSVGNVANGQWSIPAGTYQKVTFKAKQKNAPAEVKVKGIIPNESLEFGDLQWTKPESKKSADLPQGYSLFDGSAPTDRFGRPQLFEPMGIYFLNDDIVFISTRTAGIWKLVKGKWHLFAEGTFESLGIIAESENSVVIGEKPGLTRLLDRDGDHWAESRENLSDQFRLSGNYHEYLHGPVKLGKNYYYTLNLGHGVANAYNARGRFMGTNGGLRGWMCEVDEKGHFSTFASGFRSPAGLAVSPDKQIIYTENQGEYVGTSKIYQVKKGRFYGHPSGLIDLPGKNNKSPEIQWDAVKDTVELPLALLPHRKVMNSPGNPVWDTTTGKFGPFAGQMFLGDQTLSRIYRVDIQEVNGTNQGVVLPFVNSLPSGAMRLSFNPADNTLWVGQTGRGWTAIGGAVSALQKISWDGSVPDAIKTVKVTPTGFMIHFTKPQDKSAFGAIRVKSWHYHDSRHYGSKELGSKDEKIVSQNWQADGLACHIAIEDFKVADKKSGDSSKVYNLILHDTKFGKANGKFQSEAFYTLHAIPK